MIRTVAGWATRSHWRLLIVVVVVAAVAEVARRLGARQILDSMLSQHPGWLFLAVCLSVANLCLSADRSRWILETKPPFLRIARITSVACIVNHLTLFTGGGIAAKIVGFQRIGVSAGSSARAIGAEVLLDVLVTSFVTLCGLLVFGAGLFMGKPEVENDGLTAFALVCCIAVVGYASSRLGWSLGQRTECSAAEPVALAVGARRFVWCLVSSLAIWCTAALAFYCLLRGGGQSVAAPATLVAICSGFLLSLMTFVPGGLGVRDVAWSAICANLTGVTMAASLAAALTLRLVSVFSSGVIVAALEGLRLFGIGDPQE